MSNYSFSSTCQACGTRIAQDEWLCGNCAGEEDPDGYNPDACPDCGSDEADSVICSNCGRILIYDDDDDRGQPNDIWDDYRRSGDEKDLPF